MRSRVGSVWIPRPTAPHTVRSNDSRSTRGGGMAVVRRWRCAGEGRADTVLPLCGDADGGAVLDSLTTKGLRVLAIAGKPWKGPAPDDIEEVESGLAL